MDSSYSLLGHPRSMSSLGSTIVPITTDTLPLSPSITSPITQYDMDIADELRIPLPPSSTCSEERNGEGDETTNERPAGMERPGLDSVPNQETEESNPIHALEEYRDVQGSRAQEKSVPVEYHDRPDTVPAPLVSLDELIQLIRKDTRESQRMCLARRRFHELLLSSGSYRRLVRTSSHGYRLMVDRFRKDDMAGFSSLHRLCLSLGEDCKSSNMDSPLDSETVSLVLGLQDLKGCPNSWIYQLPSESQVEIISFLNTIRTDPEFLSNRIAALPSSELLALAVPHQEFLVLDSIFHNFSVPDRQAHSGTPKPVDDSSPMDQLCRLHKRDPLSTLIYTLFDDHSKPGSLEYKRRVETWSTVCARVMTEGKRGSDEFVSTVLNAFANLDSWPLKRQLEVFLSQLIQDGAFLLDPAMTRQMDFSHHAELQNARAAVAVSEFFDRALRTLFDLITNGAGNIGLPDGVLDFSLSILNKIKDPKKRSKAQVFIVSRWYFSSILTRTISYPESSGLLMTQHISDATRQKILKELVVRMQKQVVDIMSPWKNATLVVPEIEAGIDRLFRLFDARKPSDPMPRTEADERAKCKPYLMLSQWDCATLIRTLFSKNFSTQDDNELPDDDLYSSASSTNGSSTLTAGSAYLRSGMASSTAPSLSGTSMTSNIVSSAASFDEPFTRHENSQLPQEDGAKIQESSESDHALRLTRVFYELEAMPIAPDRSPFSRPFDTSDVVILHATGNDGKVSLNPFDTLSSSASHLPENGSRRFSKDANTLDIDRRVLSRAIVRLSDSDDLSFSAQWPDAHVGTSALPVTETASLESRLRYMIVLSQSELDFEAAHFWWKSLQSLKRIASPNRVSFLIDLAQQTIAGTAMTMTTNAQYEAWVFELSECQTNQQKLQERFEDQCNSLRDKMWYMSAVLHSSTYEDARNVTRALRTMARPALPRPSGVTAWAKQRLRTSLGHNRSEEQALNVIAAHDDHGGPSKLASDQVEITSRWLTRHSIENFCKGEERIHRFCFELEKCINRLVGENLLDSPVLWSSSLYQYEKRNYDQNPRQSNHFGVGDSPARQRSYDTFSSLLGPLPQTRNNDGSRSYSSFDSQKESASLQISRGLTTPSLGIGNTLISPGPSNKPYLPSSIASRMSPVLNSSTFSKVISTTEKKRTSKRVFVEKLKRTLLSLLLSDLGQPLWNQGSETDRWITSNISRYPLPNLPDTLVRSSNLGQGTQPDKESRQSDTESTSTLLRPSTLHSLPSEMSEVGSSSDYSSFPYDQAYGKLLAKFSTSPDPYVKFQTLHELVTLAAETFSTLPSQGDSASTPIVENFSSDSRFASIRSAGVPRTKATRLEEVKANCEERRANTIEATSHNFPSVRHNHVPNPSSNYYRPWQKPTKNPLPVLQTIFRNPLFRQKTLFRDLQYIAAFIPSSILDNTPQGESFWSAGLAALSLKEDLCKSMLVHANQIVAYHLTPKNPDGLPNQHLETDLSRTSLADAARLYVITALEGDPTAARELALFYLTHPELVPLVTLPLSKPSETFKAVPTVAGGLDRSSRIGLEANKQEGRGMHPETFAAVFHWMEFAANGGDGDAKAFLKENGVLGRGW